LKYQFRSLWDVKFTYARLTRLCEDKGRGEFCADREFTYNRDIIAADIGI
jgi:hypothetical protein